MNNPGFLKLFSYKGMLCFQAAPESRRVGLFYLRFKTASGRIARLECSPAVLDTVNQYYAIERLVLEDPGTGVEDGSKQGMGKD